jgi:dihydroneopterin aldolase
MNGIIGFENFQVDCIIGIYPEERLEKQTIFVDLKVEVDISNCIHSDNINEAIDYVKLTHLCKDLAQAHQFNLMETYASQVLQEIFRNYPASWVWIKVKKPKAIPQADFAIVEIEKRKK